MSTYSKLWLQKTLNATAITRAEQAIKMQGKALPCRVVAVNGAIVTVSFQVNSAPYVLPRITIPKAESNWFRYPTQVGDLGITIPADVYIGIVSGLGATIPDINVRPANLSALVFLPVSNSNSAPQDQNAAIAQGPNGFIGQVVGGTSSVVANSTGVTLTFGSGTIVINSAGITMTSSGQTLALNSSGVMINGLSFGTHYHTGVTAGTANTGGPA